MVWKVADIYFLMNLSIKNGGYAFLMRLDLTFSMSLWKELQLLQILSDLSIRCFIKVGLCENDIKLWKFKRSSVICLKRDILIIDPWNEYIKKSDGMVNLFFYSEFNVRMSII